MISYADFMLPVRQPPALRRVLLDAAGIYEIGKPIELLETLTIREAVLLHTVLDLLHFKLADEHAAIAFARCFKEHFHDDPAAHSIPFVVGGVNWRSQWLWLAWVPGKFLDCKTCTISDTQPDSRVGVTLDVSETMARVSQGGSVCYGRPGPPEGNE